MRDVLGPGTILGYCTNVHAGSSLLEIKQNLEHVAVPIKRLVSPNQPMGVGLWFSATVLEELIQDGAARDTVPELREWLDARGLLPFTLNGFPYGNFHQAVVKKLVYQPDWSDSRRLKYTRNLAILLDHLLPTNAEGSISTVPLGWNKSVGPGWSERLQEMVLMLASIEQATGRLIHLDLEPEPGCEVGDAHTFMMMMANLELTSDLPADLLRRHLRVCHDICHGAVMFESPTTMLHLSRSRGFRIGKVQVSSAPVAKFTGHDTEHKSEIRDQLSKFVEPRYLHQTTIGSKDGVALTASYDDLPDALQRQKTSVQEWRVHFHVPVFLESIGLLDTTQNAICAFFAEVQPEDGINHFEVETYAWDVLPNDLKVPDLAQGIARELSWVKEQAAKI